MDTNELVDALAAEAAPVRPLAGPWTRAGVWFAVSTTYVVILIVIMSRADRLIAIRVSRFWLEQAAAIGVGAAAAAAACLSIIPGRSRGWAMLPAFPLAAWAAVLASGCLRDWAQRGAAGLAPHADWPCTIAMLLGAALPVAALLLVARRGAPLTPALTAGFAGLAGGALSSVVACVSHSTPHPTTMTVVAWHWGTLIVIVAVAVLGGRRLLVWPSFQTRRAQ